MPSGGEEEQTAPYPRAAKLRMDPLDVRFSQTRIRHLFRDRRKVTEAAANISAKPCSQSEAKEYGVRWRLHAPFPDMEVIRWRCKLRDEKTGEAKLDPTTGKEMFDSEERWFTLDNRRLYCLQEAAVRLLPDRCLVDVAEVRGGTHIGLPELKKFRTLDLGRSILIGSRSDAMPNVRWSWKDEAKKPTSSGTSVFTHIVKHDGGKNTHSEVSKKLSWILRRGAASMNVHMDGEGWVKVHDLLKLSVFNGIGQQQFFKIVQAANTEKARYEIKGVGPGQPGVMIRASRGSKQTAAEVELEVNDGVDARVSMSPMKVPMPALAAPPALDLGGFQQPASASSKGKAAGGKKGRGAAGSQLPQGNKAQALSPEQILALQALRNQSQVAQRIAAAAQQIQAQQALQQRLETLQAVSQLQAASQLHAMQLQAAQQLQAQAAQQQQHEMALAAMLEAEAQQQMEMEPDISEYYNVDGSVAQDFSMPIEPEMDFHERWAGMSWDEIAWAQSEDWENQQAAKENARDLTPEEIAARVAQVHRAAMARNPLQSGGPANEIARMTEARAAGKNGVRNGGDAATGSPDLQARISAVLEAARSRSQQGISL